MAAKPLLSVFEKIIIIGLIAFFGYSFFKKGSFTVMERTENTTILDAESSAERYRELEFKEQKQTPLPKRINQKKVSNENFLKNLAHTFSKGKEVSMQKMKEMGLSNDEVKYYKEVKQEHNLSDEIQNAKDWFRVLKTSASTYGKVKSFVNDLSKKAGSEEDVNAMLQEDAASDDFYKKLKESFGISEAEAEAFSSLGKKKVSDWARFIEEKGGASQ